MSKEKEPAKQPKSKREKRPSPSELPPEVADFLKDKPFACVSQATDKGTAYVVKAPH